MAKISTDKKSLTLESIEKIQKKAYELYEKRGRQAGHELEDWLKAERMIRTGKS